MRSRLWNTQRPTPARPELLERGVQQRVRVPALVLRAEVVGALEELGGDVRRGDEVVDVDPACDCEPAAAAISSSVSSTHLPLLTS